ncbi:MAG TPA: hypothetical protein VEL06_17525 [Haliangiales bacterium]|nr:hypothetical protein [Haliangiales bacterium]
MKTRTVLILAAVVVAAMIVEWQFVAFMTEARIVHGYHGTCNGGVGQPYADFVRELRKMADSGDTNRLAIVLRRADERSRDIYDVWLTDKRDAYQESIHEILK